MENRKNFLGMDFVKIPDRDYYMGMHTVTQKDWKAVMGTEPWKGKEYVKEGPDYPATYISWDDCQKFIKRLNDLEGVDKYRMPTEKEWEHACRAGSETEYCFGDDAGQLGDYALYGDNAWNVGEEYAHEVGTKLPNDWGLYDMHGNVWEWCEDWYHNSYYGAPDDGTAWDDDGSLRVRRGGSVSDNARDCRSANRGGYYPAFSYRPFGLRLVRVEA